MATIATAEMESRYGSIAFIATFGVDRDLQGRGIGSSLMQRALHHLWKQGLRTVELGVKSHNQKAIRVYEKFGFELVPAKTMTTLRKEM